MGTGFGRSRVRSSRRLCSHHMVFGRRRLQPGAKYGMEEWGTKRRLTIRDIGVDDDGIYLCEMPDGGRSIAEVAVKGTILRKLPRKVDVLEGENAAYCVEVEKEEMDIHWYKDGVELRETHQTIIKSFGRTHILVFVNTMPQDSGLVTFLVGRSKTSSQLRVKAARHCPPSCPVGVQINTERANAALLSWVPAQDSRRNPPAGYVLERQEVGTGSQEWLQCLTTDSATSVEILGDSVPCEADYRFRICSVNKYGKSNNVEFPRGVHLVPVARIQAPLQDALVPEGQDAHFSIELSASVIGTWFLNGTQLQEDERYSMRRTRTHQSLRIRGVRDTDNGAEITFIAYGIRDSAAMYIQAPLVKFSPLSEMDRNKFVEIGNPIVLYCELSDPAAPVHWYKNGVELQTMEGLHIQSEGTMRRIVIQSAEFSHSGVYCCDAIDDVIRFNVEVEAPPVRFSAIPDAERNKTVQQGCPIVLQCELSDPCAQVYWYKDGSKLLPQPGVDILTDGFARKLIIPTAEFFHTGLYCCKTKGDSVLFNVDVKAPPVKFSAIPEELRTKWIEAGCPLVLQCVVSDAEAHVCWYRDEMQLIPHSGLEITSEGNRRTLVVQCTEVCHSGVYRCTTQDDTMDFQVEIKATSPRLSSDQEKKSSEDPYPVDVDCNPSKCNYAISSGKSGDMACEEHSRQIPPESAFKYLTERIKTKEAKELFDNHRTINARSSVYSSAVKSTTMQNDIQHHKNQAPESQGEDFIYYVQHAEAPSEERDTSLETSAKTDEFRSFLQTATVESDEAIPRTRNAPSEVPHHSVQITTVGSDLDNTLQSSNAKVKHQTKSLQIPTRKSDKLCHPMKLPQLDELLESSHIENVQKEQLFASSQSVAFKSQENLKASLVSPSQAVIVQSQENVTSSRETSSQPETVQSEEPLTSLQSLIVQPEKLVTSLQSIIVQSNKPSTSLQSLTAQSDEPVTFPKSVTARSDKLHTSSPAAAIQSEELFTSSHAVAVQSQELLTSPETETFHSNELYTSSPGTAVQSKDLFTSLDNAGFQSKELFTSSDAAAVQSTDLHTSVQTATVQSNEKQELLTSVHKTTNQSEEPLKILKTTTTPSEELHSNIQMLNPMTVKTFDGFKTEKSEWPYISAWTPTDYQEELDRPVQTSTRQSEELDGLHHTASLKSLDLITLKTAPQVQQGNQEFATNDLLLTEQAASSHSDGLNQSMQSTAMPETCCQPKSTVGKLADTGNSGQRASSIFAESCMKLASTVQSEAIYLSCGNQWNDSVTANKVAVEAPPVRITTLCEAEKKKSVEAGEPLMLRCEISDPNAQVTWYKDGVRLHEAAGHAILAEASARMLMFGSAVLSHAGIYCCKTRDDAVAFHVDVKAQPARFSYHQESDRNICVHEGSPIVLRCELSHDPSSHVDWTKDGIKLLPQNNMETNSEGLSRTLHIHSAEKIHAGVYECSTSGHTITFEVDVKGRSPQIMPIPPSEKYRMVAIGCPIILQCEVSDPAAQVSWFKDGGELYCKTGLDMKRDGSMRKLIIQSAKLSDSGIYGCSLTDDVVTFHVDVKATPVKFSALPEVVRNKFVEAGCPIQLQCEVSEPSAQVYWHKDGDQLPPQSEYEIQTKEKLRALLIKCAEVRHSGLYSCEAEDDHIEFKVDVAAPPVTFADIAEEDLFKTVVEQEELLLTCEVSRVDGVVQWYKDGAELQQGHNTTIQADGTKRNLTINSAQLSDMGTYTCRAGDNVIMFKVNIREPPVTIIHPREDVHLERHVPEEIILSCELSRPNGVVSWYKDGQKLQESENIKLKIEGPYRRLKILCSRAEDSGEYVCDTADDSIFFHLNITEPPVRILSPSQSQMELCQQTSERMVLSCEISRPNAVVRWYRNGLEVEENNNLILEVDGVYRRLIIPKTTVKDSAEYVCDTTDDSMTFFVNIAEPPVRFIRSRKMTSTIEKVAGETLVLDCEVSRSNAEVTWKRNGEEIEDSRNITILEDGVMRQLTVHSLTVDHSGQYVCDAKDDVMDFLVKIKEPPVQIIGNSGHPEHHTLVAGDDLILECEVSRPSATVQWLRNGKILKPGNRVTIDRCDVVRKLVLSGLQPSDSGTYVCDAIDDQLVTVVEVQAPPVKFVNKEASNEVSACESESVTLRAVVNWETANVRWLKDGQLLDKENIHISSEGKTHKLTINPLQLSDSGEYVCDVNTDEMHFSLSVKEMMMTFTRPLEDTASLKGSSLTLRCEINKLGGDVQWLKDGQEICPGRRHTIRAQGRERSITIHQLMEQDSGEYVCESTHDRTAATVTVEIPRVVEILAELRNITVCEGEDAVFKCVVSPEDARLVWRFNGKQVTAGGRVVISSNGLCHMLCIHNCTVSDSTRVTAEAEGLVSEAELQVQEQQVIFTKKMLPVTAEEYSEATLEVEVSLDTGEVQWMRQGVLIHPGAKCTLKHKGRKRSLTIHNLAVSDRGTYSCETLHDRTQTQLTVEPRKITIKRGLTDIKTTERETATFEVELSHPQVVGMWMRNGIQLKQTNHFRMSAKGKVHSLTVSNLSIEDTGTFMFCVERQKTSARLVVKEPPVTIVRKLQDQRVSDGAVISIECELSRHNVDVKWTKNGTEIKPSKDLRIYAMGRKRFLQILKCNVVDSGIYTCDAGDTTTSCNVEVYERELLITQGLNDLDIQEDQNAVFICELTVEDIPGEWYKNGERIQPTSTVKIRQEGTKHFLLMCNVRPEDSGEIKFIARRVESVAYLDVEELPVNIVKPLEDKTALEMSRVILDCTVSNPRCSIRWYKGCTVILPSERFEICSEGGYRKLIIQQVALDDAGTYSVQVGEYSCSAKLTVEAQPLSVVRELVDVEVTAPDEARFECEVSAPVVRTTEWSLNGERLKSSSCIRVEKMGAVHRLILKQTSTDMSGAIEFTCGKAKSRAQLQVLSGP
ncbi:obscurin-like isoform X2 [Takifugu flavidus]|uniref:obscurin-like isoform X2 n=1 Tax=Takifugu flavidus TaxID=433684 RepID=UPI0025444A4E|nr:obscurin-like isoform X2 [Takifugu flavidus]